MFRRLKTIENYDIPDGSLMNMVLRIRGGLKVDDLDEDEIEK